MRQLGPEFLHRPLALPHFAAPGAVLQWLTDGALALFPARFVDRGWRPESVVYSYARDGSTNIIGVLEETWSGARRIVPPKGDHSALPVSVVLDPGLIFMTTADLPLAAQGTLNQTIELRMDDLSPIPPEQAAFAVGDVARAGERLHAEMAITRKETLAAVATALAGKDVQRIGAGPAAGGKLEFVFSQSASKRSQQARRWLFALLALWASLMLALGVLQERQEKTLASLEAYQNELRGELRAMKADSERQNRLQQFAPPSFSLAEMTGAAASGLTALPDGAVVTELSIDGGRLTISGLTPQGGDNAALINRAASDYPGYDRFTSSAPVISASAAETPGD